jgi:hypothetical protein
MTDTHHAIIKADQRGRLRFAQLHGLNYQTFAGWL